MATIHLSPKFQIVMRKALHLIAGQQLEAHVTDGKIELIPLQPMQAARGLFPDIDTRAPNDPETLSP